MRDDKAFRQALLIGGFSIASLLISQPSLAFKLNFTQSLTGANGLGNPTELDFELRLIGNSVTPLIPDSTPNIIETEVRENIAIPFWNVNYTLNASLSMGQLFSVTLDGNALHNGFEQLPLHPHLNVNGGVCGFLGMRVAANLAEGPNNQHAVITGCNIPHHGGHNDLYGPIRLNGNANATKRALTSWFFFLKGHHDPPQAVAEPGTIALLGSALAGLGLWMRRRRLSS